MVYQIPFTSLTAWLLFAGHEGEVALGLEVEDVEMSEGGALTDTVEIAMELEIGATGDPKEMDVSPPIDDDCGFDTVLIPLADPGGLDDEVGRTDDDDEKIDVGPGLVEALEVPVVDPKISVDV